MGETVSTLLRKTLTFFLGPPKLKGIVTYRNLTKKGYLRIPSFEY